MVCKPRFHFLVGVCHVILCGNGEQDILFSDEDRYHLYLLLQEGAERFDSFDLGFVWSRTAFD